MLDVEMYQSAGVPQCQPAKGRAARGATPVVDDPQAGEIVDGISGPGYPHAPVGILGTVENILVKIPEPVNDGPPEHLTGSYDIERVRFLQFIALTPGLSAGTEDVPQLDTESRKWLG